MTANSKTITVDAETFRRFLRERSAASALARRADKRKESFGLPEASKATTGEYVILDGNKQPIGKLTIAPRDGYEVKAGYVARVS